ncbi:unnamed protein product, partial [Rotaria sp. Silwood2]
SGYTSLHVACHFGQINMVRYLLKVGADVNIETNLMFTPLHSAAQQGHVMIVKLLLEYGASPNKTNKHGMTALSIAQRLGYISVVEELKVVTETTIASKHELITEERYKIQAPEVSHEEHPLTDSEDETAEDNIEVIYPEIGYFISANSTDNVKIHKKTTKGSHMSVYPYLPVNEYMLGDASSNVHMQYLREGVLMTEAEENKLNQTSFIKEETEYPMLAAKDHWTESRDNLHDQPTPTIAPQTFVSDNETITKPRHAGFLVSFLVDARGGAMRGCRHSGVRVIIPPKRASMPTRITCRFVKREKLTIPPPLNEGEALAARVLEVGPVACKFLGPVILEIPHFASLRNREREIVVLRSDNGEKWTEHTGPTTDEAVREVLGDVVDSEDLDNAEELHSRRITRIITNDFPRFFALITRIRQEAHFIDEQGGLLISSIISTVQAHIPEKALQKRIRISLHVLPISSQLVQRSFGSRVNVSPVITVEPRRRKFHKPITLTIPLPSKSATTRKHSHQQHANAYTSDSQSLRLLCSITGGTHAAQFDDITGHTPLTFSNDCATFTTTVSARFWLIDAQGTPDVLKLAHEIYREAISVPYMSRFIVFAKRHDLNEALVRLFCITDDKENKTLEMQEHFTEIAKSKEVEVVNGNSIYIDLQSNNLQTIIKTNEQLTLVFRAFKENRLPCVVRIRDQEQEPSGRLIFSKDNGKLTSIQRTTSITMTNGQPSSLSSTTIIDPQALQTICNLNIIIPAYDKDLLESEERLRALHSVERDRHSESWKSDDMYRKGEIRLTDIARLLGSDWPALAAELELSEDEVTKIMDEFGENASLQMLRYWLKSRGNEATGNCLQQALRKIGKENIVHNCVFNIEWVTDAAEKELAKARLNSRGGSVDGTAISGRRLDEGFESDDEYERRRQGKSNFLTDDTNRIPTTTIIKTITFEEIGEDDLGGKKPTNEKIVSQFKQLEPLKMVKRDHSKDFIPSSSSTSSADTIVTVAMRKSLGERDGPLYFVDSSKAPTPASRYGGYYSIYHPQNYSGSITPLNYQSHPFEMMHLESLREKLNRLSRDKADLDDPYGTLSKQRSTDMDEGRITPKASSEFQSKKSSSKLGDFGIVNIVQEATPTLPDNQTNITSIQSDINEKPTPTQQLAEQTVSMLDDIPPIRANQPPVSERLIKSKIIPEPARALANALKHAVVRPLKRTIKKKKSFDGNLTEQQITCSHSPIVHSFSQPSSILIENHDQQLNEISIDSNESTSPITLTSSPTKPPRLSDESGSSSSIEVSSPPPAKPPRHFSLYKNENDNNVIQQTNDVVKKVLNIVDTFNNVQQNDHHTNILRQSLLNANPSLNCQISNSLKNIETFSVQPTCITINTNLPLTTKSFDNDIDKPMTIKSFSTSIEQSNSLEKSTNEIIPIEIIQLAKDLTENILQEVEKRTKSANFDSTINNNQQILFDKLAQLEQEQKNNKPCDNMPSFSHSKVTTHILPTQTTSRPLMFVSLSSSSNPTKKNLPLLDIVTTKATPLFTTSVKVTSPSTPILSSTTTITNTDEELNNTSTLISNSNKTSNNTEVLQTNSKQDRLDSNDPTAYEDTVILPQNIGNTTSIFSFLSDYDNLRGSSGSLNDDNQQTQTLPSTVPSSSETISSTASSSMTTIYQSFDNFPSLSSSTTSPTYVSAASTFNTGGTTTPQHLDSDISDEELVESVDSENSPQDNFETTNVQSSFDKEATLASKVEEPPLSSLSSASESLSLLISVSSASSSTTFPSFPPFHITTKTSSKLSSNMSNKTSNITLQNFNNIPSTLTNLNEDKPINNNQQEKKDSNINLQSPIHQRRLPLPDKLTFEQNITNLIEKESPLLQSELLTTEHELSVFRSRLAVNEGVTAVTGTILESLKEQFESNHKTDSTTSPVDKYKTNIFQHSLSVQTSPITEILPESIEIHYDAESPKSPYILVKAINSFWIVQPIDDSEVEKHLKRFSSPIMKRAAIKLPDTFHILNYNSDDEEIFKEKLNEETLSSLIPKTPTNIDEENKTNDLISEENESSTTDQHGQLGEMKKIHSSSLHQYNDQFEKFNDKIDEIYSIIDCVKHDKFTSTVLNNLHVKLNDLKLFLRHIHLNKQDELRIEYELDELENFFNKTSKHDDYNFIELFEQNLRELQYIVQEIKILKPQTEENFIKQFELIRNNNQKDNSNKSLITSKTTYNRLIPENPVVTSDIFFESNKILKQKKISPTNPPRLIPEDARISASSFYEGDINRSLYQHSEQEKQIDISNKRKTLIPEKPYISFENFYEGDPQRSMFIERPLLTHTESLASSSSPPISIDNLRAIMSDLMLVASWSKKPKMKTQQTKPDVEVEAESFITAEKWHSKLCEITHEIENFSLSHPSILIEEQDTISPVNIELNEEKNVESSQMSEHEENLNDMVIIETSSNEDQSKYILSDTEFIIVSSPSFKQDNKQQLIMEPCSTIDLELNNNENILTSSSLIKYNSEPIENDSFSNDQEDINEENLYSSQTLRLYNEDYMKSSESIISHVQRSNIISKTITSYNDEGEAEGEQQEEEEEDMEESHFRPTHLDIYSEEQMKYENLLIKTSNNLVEQILNEAISDIIEYEQNYLYYQAAVQIVNDVMENIFLNYDNEFNLIESTSISNSSTSSDNEIKEEDEEYNDEYLSSSDDEENVKLIPQVYDQPYLFVSDVITSKSTQELGSLIQELQTLEHKIHHIHSLSLSSSSSSSSSLSDNDQIQSYDTSIPTIVKTKSISELTNLVIELEHIEEELEDKFDTPINVDKSPISSKSFNELGGLINELNNVSKQLNNRIHEEIFTSTNIDSLSQDIIKYRRDSQSNGIIPSSHKKDQQSLYSTIYEQGFEHTKPTLINHVDHIHDQSEHEQIENQVVQVLVDNIIKEAHDIMLSELSSNVSQTIVKSVPTIIIDEHLKPCHRSSVTSISDDLELSHEEYTVDRTIELAAQLDYLQRMSRYEKLTNEQEPIENSQIIQEDSLIHTNSNNDQELKSIKDLTVGHEEHPSSNENNLNKLLIQSVFQPQINIIHDLMITSEDSINQHSTDSLDYHSIEIEPNQLSNQRTTSENSLHSASSMHTYDSQSLSTSCLIDNNDLRHSNDDDNNQENLFDHVKSFCSKPIEIVSETIDNQVKQRTSESNINDDQRIDNNEKEYLTTQQHFQSAYDLHDEEKSKLVRSPELYNMKHAVKHNHRSLITNSQIQHRTLSESALIIDDGKHQNLTPSNEVSSEFLTTISKDNSLESMQQQRLSTPFDDVIEKESSPEHSESYNVPISAFSDVIEPTSSCQRPLAFCLSQQQQQVITDAEYRRVANDLVNQVLRDVIAELAGEQDDSSLSNKSDKLSTSSTSSDNDDELCEQDDDEIIQNQLSNSSNLNVSPHVSFAKVLRRAQTDAEHFEIIQSPHRIIPSLIRRNSQSDTETYFRTVSSSLNNSTQRKSPYDNSSSDEKFTNTNSTLLMQQNEKYSGEGEESSGGKQRIIQRRKRSNDTMNTNESPGTKNLSFKYEFVDNFKRQESLESPSKDSNEKLILKSLQEGILRTNLKSLQTDLDLINQQEESFHEQIYSSTTKKLSPYYDYDAGSEAERDDLKISSIHSDIVLQTFSNQFNYNNLQDFNSDSHPIINVSSSIELNEISSSINIDIKSLLDDLIESINDDLSISISSEPLSSQSDATTVIFNSNKNSMDDEESLEKYSFISSHDLNQNDKKCLIIPISSSSSSSSPTHSVIYYQQDRSSQIKNNLTSFVNTSPKKQSSIPSLSNIELISHNTKTKFRSYPGSLGGAHIPPSIESILNDYCSTTTTSTTSQSSN